MSKVVDVPEHRLRPIYDALDYGASKQALQLCNKALKKQPDALILKALKALALNKLGFEDEALSLCTEVRNGGTTDRGVLHTLTLVYNAQGLAAEVTAIYEQAFKVAPRDEEIGNHWFMGLVRMDDYKTMQQVWLPITLQKGYGRSHFSVIQAAMKLNKQFKVDKYFFWVVMSIYLQADTAPAVNRAIMYQLAERMIAKGAQENRLSTFEDLQLYLLVLRAQNNFAEALEVIKGNLSTLCKVESERLRLQLDLSKEIGLWKDVIEISEQLLREKFIVQQQKGSSEKYGKRGPYLAELQLEMRQAIIEEEKSPVAMRLLLIKYMNRFGSTLSCFDDLRQFLDSIADTESSALIAECAPEKSGEKEGTLNFVRQTVNAKKMERFYSRELQPEQKLATIAQLIKLYNDVIPLGAHLDERELQPGDDYLLLAAHELVDLFVSDRGTPQYLYEAIVILEYGLQRSKYNYQMKLLLIRLYFEAGVFKRPITLAASLDVKHVQNDTLSYLFTDDIELLGCFEPAIALFYKTLTIYQSNEREVTWAHRQAGLKTTTNHPLLRVPQTPEMIVQAFKFATFSKIPEFIRFRDRLRNSLQKTVSTLQATRVSLFLIKPDGFADFAEHSLDEDKLLKAASLRNCTSDNRDKTIMADWNRSGPSVASRLRGEAFPRDRNAWIKIQAIIQLFIKRVFVPVGESWAELHEMLQTAISGALELNEHERHVSNARLVLRVMDVLKRIDISGPTEHESVHLAEFDDVLSTFEKHSQVLLKQLEETQGALSYDILRDIVLYIEGYTYVRIGFEGAIRALAPTAGAKKSGKGPGSTDYLAETH
ncbi:N-alpha-acetyltransferase 25, NatB auxiliary subunit [Borealophlyctis nickersoniae]|nr:N-alpha-acetyltransferase 25, NatB auxiliary subunit [Borealophlyctis nickersoniae]